MLSYMNLFKFINIPVFILSLAFGIFCVYITASNNRKIIVYPTHENIHLLQYRDKTNTCFALAENEIKCPKDTKQISKIPSQA